MTKFIVSIASSTLALLISGTAYAAPLQPAAGEAPFFDDPVLAVSKVQRADVEVDAARHMPAAGEMSAQAAPAASRAVTLAQMR